MLSVIMLSVIMLSVIMLSVIMLSVIMLSVTAPSSQLGVKIFPIPDIRKYIGAEHFECLQRAALKR